MNQWKKALAVTSLTGVVGASALLYAAYQEKWLNFDGGKMLSADGQITERFSSGSLWVPKYEVDSRTGKKVRSKYIDTNFPNFSYFFRWRTKEGKVSLSVQYAPPGILSAANPPKECRISIPFPKMGSSSKNATEGLGLERFEP